MKKLFLLSMVLMGLNSCSSDSEQNNPNLSFNIEEGNRFASSEITVTNTTTNYDGTYIWEVISPFGTETFNTQNLTFMANRVGNYTIKLKTSNNEAETQQSITITQPSILKLKTLTLTSIPQDYEALYFILFQVDENSETGTYQSEPQNSNAANASEAQWEVDGPGGLIDISDGSDADEAFAYQIKFYVANNPDPVFHELITRLEPFDNFYDESIEYVNGEMTLTTFHTCNCYYFEVVVEFEFNN